MIDTHTKFFVRKIKKNKKHNNLHRTMKICEKQALQNR